VQEPGSWTGASGPRSIASMSAAAKILTVGGLLSLALAFAYGFRMAALRTGTPESPQPLLLQAHRSALWEGFMLLGLNWAVVLSGFGSGPNIAAAALVV